MVVSNHNFSFGTYGLSKYFRSVSEKPKNKWTEALKLIAKIGVSALAIYLIVKKVDINTVWGYLKNAHYGYLILGFVVFLFSKYIAGLRMNYLLAVNDVKMSNLQVFKLSLLGMFYNLFLPGGLSGDGYKVYWLKKTQDAKVGSMVWVTLLDRGTGMLLLLILAIICFWFVPYPFEYKSWLLLAIPLLLAGYYLMLRLFFKKYTPAYWNTVWTSLVVQILQVVTAELILLAMGIHSEIITYWFMFLVATLGYVIPITIGGLGAREIVLAYGAEYLAIDSNISIAMGVLFYLIIALNSLLGIYYVLRPAKLESDGIF